MSARLVLASSILCPFRNNSWKSIRKLGPSFIVREDQQFRWYSPNLPSKRYHPWMVISEDVSEALDCGKPIVALESTVITHGMPYPKNLETAILLQQIAKENGAEPATVAVIDGRLCVGLVDSQLEMLSKSSSNDERNIRKVSRKDFPLVLGRRGCFGGTTVSGTMIAAHWAGINIFATGGVGGVHRGGEHSMDVSADLAELGRTPVCVVSAGIKSLLDIPRSLEYLETRGACVVGMNTNEFPAFFTRKSGVPCPGRVNSPKDAAHLVHVMIHSKMTSGVLVAVPIPEEDEAEYQFIEEAIQEAIKNAEFKNVTGPAVTPYVLARVSEITKGRSLEANIRLIENNVKVAAHIAVEYSKLMKLEEQRDQYDEANDDSKVHSSTSFKQLFNRPYEIKPVVPRSSNLIIVCGGSSVDQICRIKTPQVFHASELRPLSYHGTIIKSCGGVGRNIAEILSRLGSPVRLLTALANDLAAEFLKSDSTYIDWKHAKVLPSSDLTRTASYTVILNSSGSLLHGMGDMDIHREIDTFYLEQKLIGEKVFQSNEDDYNSSESYKCSLVCTDGNLTVDSLSTILQLCHQYHIPLWYEPTDALKATKVIQAFERANENSDNNQTKNPHIVDYISPNFVEFQNLYEKITSKPFPLKETSKSDTTFSDYINKLCEAVDEVKHICPTWMIKLGRNGVLFSTSHFIAWYDSPLEDDQTKDGKPILSVSGAGDSLVGAFIHLRFSHGLDWHESILGGLRAAELSMQEASTVSPRLKARDFSNDSINDWAKNLSHRIISQ